MVWLFEEAGGLGIGRCGIPVAPKNTIGMSAGNSKNLLPQNRPKKKHTSVGSTASNSIVSTLAATIAEGW